MKAGILSLVIVVSLFFTPSMTAQENTRVEKDLLGQKEIPASAYYGVQTARALENFQISDIFLPTYGTLLAAVSFDQTGTTRIGKYLFNHSFMLPGLVTMFSAIIFALVLNSIVA